MGVYNISGDRLDSGQTASLADYGDLTTASGFVSAFNAAVNDTSINGIILPYGSYSINNDLNMRSNFHVDGNGSTINHTGTHNGFKFNGISGCTVKNLKIDMHQTKDSTGGTAFYILDSSDITVRDCTIVNIGVRACLAYTSDATDGHYNDRLIFDNVRMEGIGENNTYLSEWPCGIIAVNSRFSTFKDCYVSGMSRFTLEWKNYSSYCSMINNTIIGGRQGLCQGGDRPQEETVLGHDITYVGNRISDCVNPVYFGRAKNVIVSGNVLSGDQIFVENSSDCLISNNEFNGADDSSVALMNICNNARMFYNENVYTKASGVDLFRVVGDASTVFVTGYYNNNRIDVHSPTNGTPTA